MYLYSFFHIAFLTHLKFFMVATLFVSVVIKLNLKNIVTELAGSWCYL